MGGFGPGSGPLRLKKRGLERIEGSDPLSWVGCAVDYGPAPIPDAAKRKTIPPSGKCFRSWGKQPDSLDWCFCSPGCSVIPKIGLCGRTYLKDPECLPEPASWWWG